MRLVVVLVLVAAIFVMYRRSQQAVLVAAPDPRPVDELDGVDIYWRPGCVFCAALGRSLTRAGIPLHRHNIWEDPDRAATVRAVADGDETVPTVIVGPVALVNPSLRQVRSAVAEHAPHLLARPDIA